MVRTTSTGYAVCIRNDGADDLIVGKIYPVVPDQVARPDGHIRVIDDSGDDYLYPAFFFSAIVSTEDEARALRP